MGNYVSFSCTVQGGPKPQLQWLFNEQPIPGANNPNLYFPVNYTNQSGGYSLVASNMYGMVTSVVAHLTVRVSPPSFASEPVSRGVLEGEPVTFSAYAWAPGPVQCQWQFNGQNIPDATELSLTIQHTTRSDAGDYRIIISNEGGSITSKVATLVITLPGPLDRWEWRHPLPQGNDLLCVAYGNGIWVASGKEGTHRSDPLTGASPGKVARPGSENESWRWRTVTEYLLR